MRALNAARLTVDKEALDHEPSSAWKLRMLQAEHSPIRLVQYDITLTDIPNFVCVHLCRHHEGVEKFVVSKRQDRSGDDPTEVNRLTPVSMLMTCNAQALINISRKRLCSQASKETREVWQMVKDEMQKIDPEVASVMVKECVYRGFCPELKPCGYSSTQLYIQNLNEYRCYE